MEINRNSWHYKVYKRFWFCDSDNLCEYFWKFIWSFIIYSLFFLWVIAIVICIIMAIVKAPWVALTMLVGVLFIAFSIILPILTIKQFRKVYSPEQTALAPKTSNILMEYLKAVKGKYCPRINYID